MAAASAVPPCGIEFTSSACTLCWNAVLSIVSGHSRNASPANATSPSRSAPAVCINSSAASLARASRFGAMSVVSMDLDVSTATTMSSPRCSTSCRSNPCCGRASVTISSATARIRRANRIFRRAGEMPTVNADSSRASMNCVSSFCRARFAPPEKQRQRRRNHQQQPEKFDARIAFQS